jgi:hypothetical protein
MSDLEFSKEQEEIFQEMRETCPPEMENKFRKN